MCGRFVRSSPITSVVSRFGVEMVDIDLPPSYNIAPSQKVLMVRGNGARCLVGATWGLIPSWVKDPGKGEGIINARAETVAVKPSFRQAFLHHRCLIVADGFFEWERRDSKKQPVYIRLTSRELFGFAGLYAYSSSPEGKRVCTCTIITTAPNDLVRPIHDRMPVILSREKEDLWLDPSITREDTLLPLLVPYSSQAMEAYPVSRRMNTPSYNSPETILPL